MLMLELGETLLLVPVLGEKKTKQKKKTAAVLGFQNTMLSRVCDGQQFVRKENPSTCHRDMSEERWPEAFKLKVKATS